MLTATERARLKGLEIWQYRKVPGGFRRVVVFLKHGGNAIPRDLLVDAAKSMGFDADDQFTVEYRGIGSADDLGALYEAQQVFDEALPGRSRSRVHLDRDGLALLDRLDGCERCVDFGDAAPPTMLVPVPGGCEALLHITPTNQAEVPGRIGPLFRAGFNPITVEADHALDWSPAELVGLEGTLVAIQGVASFFRDAGLVLLDREWICRGARDGHCGVGAETVAIAPDGRQYACARFVGFDETQAIGHVADSLWITARNRYATYHPSLNRTCGGKGVDHTCLGGCAYLNFRRNRDVMDGVAAQCAERRQRIDVARLV